MKCANRRNALDIGCGTGIPIGKIISDHGFSLTGIDSSQLMIDEFKKNLPGAIGICKDITECEVTKYYDFIVSWGCIFHLNYDQQKRILQIVASQLQAGGVFPFTANNTRGTCAGTMFGKEFTYYSLDRDDYIECLKLYGVVLEWDDFDKSNNYTYCFSKQR